MTPLACPACSTLAASTDVVCAKCGVALPGRGAPRSGVPKWVWITGGVVLGCGGIGCVGLFATFFLPRVMQGIESAKESAALLAIMELQGAVEHYALTHDGRYPESLEVALADADAMDGAKPRRLERDPWKNPYVYRPPTVDEPHALVFSTGRDGIADTADDVYGELTLTRGGEHDEADPVERTFADIEQITVAAIEYATRNGGSYPVSLEVLWMPDANGARYLDLDGPPLDAWGNVYVYRAPETAEGDPLVFSAGPDGIAGTEDDVGVEDTSDVEDEGDDESTEPR